jgi:hypothetical protein
MIIIITFLLLDIVYSSLIVIVIINLIDFFNVTCNTLMPVIAYYALLVFLFLLCFG